MNGGSKEVAKLMGTDQGGWAGMNKGTPVEILNHYIKKAQDNEKSVHYCFEKAEGGIIDDGVD